MISILTDPNLLERMGRRKSGESVALRRTPADLGASEANPCAAKLASYCPSRANECRPGLPSQTHPFLALAGGKPRTFQPKTAVSLILLTLTHPLPTRSRASECCAKAAQSEVAHEPIDAREATESTTI